MGPEAHGEVFSFFLAIAYEPWKVYAFIVAMMFASSFGLPFPEEATLLSAGLLAHIGSRPDLYPPPSPDAVGVGIYTTAVVCFLSVFMSDLLVFSLGKTFGPRLRQTRLLQRLVKPEAWTKIDAFTTKYGAWACGVFRFTPGLRFPGHFTCGSLGIPYRKFIAVDGAAVLLSVPTQVLLMAYYGQEILGVLKNVKIVAFSVAGVVIAVWLWKRRKRAKAAESLERGAPGSRDESRSEEKSSAV